MNLEEISRQAYTALGDGIVSELGDAWQHISPRRRAKILWVCSEMARIEGQALLGLPVEAEVRALISAALDSYRVGGRIHGQVTAARIWRVVCTVAAEVGEQLLKHAAEGGFSYLKQLAKEL